MMGFFGKDAPDKGVLAVGELPRPHWAPNAIGRRSWVQHPHHPANGAPARMARVITAGRHAGGAG